MHRLAPIALSASAVVLAACGDAAAMATTTGLELDGSSTTTEDPDPTLWPDPTSGVDPAAPNESSGDTPTTGDGGDPGLTFCGDKVVQGNEQCDDGFDANLDENACTAACKLAVCGDGKLQKALGETCDLGEQNQPNPEYGGCNPLCQLGPHCGDGIVQTDQGEQCEPGPEPIASGSCKTDCSFFRRIVFLSSKFYQGDPAGLKGADKLCNDLARTARTSGTFKAWLLVDGQQLKDRFLEYDFAAPFVFVTVDNVLLANSLKQLYEQGPPHAVATTETGDEVYEALVWTNITPNGLAAGGDCDSWKNTNDGKALVGLSGYPNENGVEHLDWVANRKWTSIEVDQACLNDETRIYCIQVAD